MTGLATVLGAYDAVASSPQYHLRKAAAAYVTRKFFPCSPKTLAKLAVVGGGPAYRKAGRFPLYSELGLNEWAESRIGPSVHSSSEARSLSSNRAA
jgi:hypothetical protein